MQRYVEIDRELCRNLIGRIGGAAAFGAKIGKSKSWVEDIVRNGYVQAKVASEIKQVYGVDIIYKEQSLATAAKVPLQAVAPPMPKPKAEERVNLAEITNRLDKCERNLDDMAVTLRLMLDIMQKQEKRMKNKPYAH